MKQRLRLAFATLCDAPILLLDEPAAGLDEEGRGILDVLVRERRARGPVLLASNEPRDFDAPDRTIPLGAPP
jgi:ABC-type multidrug transport system ATPase subunit